MHPLFNNSSQLSEKEIYEKLSNLTNKYWSTTNEQLKNQIQLIIDDLKDELSKRMLKEKEQSTDLDTLINIS